MLYCVMTRLECTLLVGEQPISKEMDDDIDLKLK